MKRALLFTFLLVPLVASSCQLNQNNEVLNREKIISEATSCAIAAVVKIDRIQRSHFVKSFVGRPSDDSGPNGSSSSGAQITCTATVVDVLKGEIPAEKINFNMELNVEDSQKNRRNPFQVGEMYVILFRGKYSTEKTKQTTTLYFDSWGERCWWPEKSPEAELIVSSLK